MFQYFHQLNSSDIAQLMIIGSTGSAWINTYQVNSTYSGPTFTKVTSILNDVTPFYGVSNLVEYAEFSPDKKYLAITFTNNSLYIYKQNGLTYDYLSSVSITGRFQCAWDSTGEYLAAGYGSSPYVKVYRRSGDTFTALTMPATIPTSAAYGIRFYTSGGTIYMVVSAGTLVRQYSISGNTITFVSNIFSSSTNTQEIAFTPDTTYLAIPDFSSTGRISVLKRTGTSWSSLSTPTGGFSTVGLTACWSNDGIYLVVGGGGTTTPSASSSIRIFKRSGDTLTFLTRLDDAPLSTGNANGVAFNYDDSILSIAQDGSPYLFLYSRSGDTFTRITTGITGYPSGGATSATFILKP